MSIEVGEIAVLKGKSQTVKVYAAEDYCAVVKKGDKSNYQVDTELAQNVGAPVKAGEAVGKLLISKNGNIVKEIAVVVKEDIKHLSYFETAKKVIHKW